MRTMRAAHKKTTEEDGRIGQSIDSYRLVRRLGCGAMGAVYEVIHVNIGRRYALKLLHPHLNGNQQAVARFVSEGQTANQPAIDGVVAIHDVKRSSCGQTYILMEYLDGETLAVRIAKEFGRSDGLQRSHSGPDLRAVPRSSYVNVSLMLAKQIASTLEVIHRSGVVHRDLKPENIFVARDPDAVGGERIKILDFGIAKVVTPSAQNHSGPPSWAPTIQRTAVGTVLGTPAYMPPEQWYGSSEADARSDVYSCGAIFFEMMCGRPPFTAAFIGELMEQHFEQTPSALEEIAPWAPAPLCSLIRDMLSKRPENRPTMSQVMGRLQELIREHRQRRSSGMREQLEDLDETIPHRSVSDMRPLPSPSGPPLQSRSHALSRMLIALSCLAAVLGVSILIRSLLSPTSPTPPAIVPPIPQYEVLSHPAGARLYLFDPHHPEQSLEGLLTARCMTPCKLPQTEVKEGSVLILVKEAHRSVRLFADEVQTGALSRPLQLARFPKPLPPPPSRAKFAMKGNGKR